jgi:Flp pilus assembly pilin Flp
MRFLKDRSGAEVTEVAVIIIIIIIIVVAAYGAIRTFGLRVSALFEWLAGLF